MPLNTIIIFVVENGQTCFVIKLLITLNSKPTCVLHVFEFSSLDSSMIIRLWLLSLSSSAPESETTWNVGGRNSFVTFKIYTVGFIRSLPRPIIYCTYNLYRLYLSAYSLTNHLSPYQSRYMPLKNV